MKTNVTATSIESYRSGPVQAAITGRAAAIADLLRRYGSLTLGDVSRYLGVPASSCTAALNRLRDEPPFLVVDDAEPPREVRSVGGKLRHVKVWSLRRQPLPEQGTLFGRIA